MNNFELWQMIIGSGGLLGIAIGVVFLVFRTGRIVQKIDAFDSDFTEMKSDFKELKTNVVELKVDVRGLQSNVKGLQSDVSEIKERVTFMETFIFFSEFKAETNGSRSEMMKEVWKKRRMKQVAVKEK